MKLDIPAKGDATEFRPALDVIKVGSRLQDGILKLIARNIHPYNFVRAPWSGDMSKLGTLPNGLSLPDVARLQANVAEKELWTELLDVQSLDRPDTLDVKSKKPESSDYVPIENLSHGQKCTAVLVILLADGDTPVRIDQPGAALHAPGSRTISLIDFSSPESAHRRGACSRIGALEAVRAVAAKRQPVAP